MSWALYSCILIQRFSYARPVNNNKTPSSSLPGLKIKQKRSQDTYDTLVKTAFQLLRNRELESISIAELTKAAGYSVGAFYARFQSKDEFMHALVDHHVKTRQATHDYLFSKYSGIDLIYKFIENVVKYIAKNRGFWQSSLARSTRDPKFWKPMRALALETGTLYLDSIRNEIGRDLTDAEELNIRFAFQVTFGTINNSVINRPGPLQMNNPEYIEKLSRAFCLISDYDNLVGSH